MAANGQFLHFPCGICSSYTARCRTTTNAACRITKLFGNNMTTEIKSVWGLYHVGDIRWFLSRWPCKLAISSSGIFFSKRIQLEKANITKITYEHWFFQTEVLRFHHNLNPAPDARAGYTMYPLIYFSSLNLPEAVDALLQQEYPVLSREVTIQVV